LLPGPADPDHHFIVKRFSGPLGVGATFHTGTVTFSYGAPLNIDSIKVSPLSLPTFLMGVNSDPDVELCEPDLPLTLLFEPNDLYFATPAGAPPQTPGPQYGPWQVEAPDAWGPAAGPPSMGAPGTQALCIVDSGYDANHLDLQGGRFLGGYDFITLDATPDDQLGHGTHVTGIAAATSNNAIGIAGMAQVDVLAAKVFGSLPVTLSSIVAAGIAWCADTGGDVINLSLGGPPTETLATAVAYAWDAGAVLVAAVGNDSGPVLYPAAYPDVIAVACTTPTRGRCEFSNYGPEVDLAAPGLAAISTCTFTLPMCVADCGPLLTTGYSECSGTSMSSPHVAGAAALLWSYAPALPNRAVRAVLQCQAQSPVPGGPPAPVPDPFFGYGIVDAGAARANSAPTTCPPPSEPLGVVFNGGATTADGFWSAPRTDGGSRIVEYRIYRGTSALGAKSLVGTVPATQLWFHDAGPLVSGGTVYAYNVVAVTEYGGPGPASADALARTTGEFSTIPAGTMDCVPGAGAANAAQTVVLGSSNSGTFRLEAQGSYSAPGLPATCVFEIDIDPAVQWEGGGGDISAITDGPAGACTDGTAAGACTASASFNWRRDTHSAAFTIHFWLKVNDRDPDESVVVAEGWIRFLDPPLVGWLP
ncbi:MAG TPA: S8 family serine peptidase, partial [Candidatus Thermoplasmatota archaeon]|nr:S8 family serine peptidase [Candidatus Thermoplasmatota archaeon]